MEMQIELLQKFFQPKDFCILIMYNYLNKELTNNYFKINTESLSIFLEYSKKGDIQVFSKLWGQHSIQRDVFIFCEEIFKHFNQNPTLPKELFFKDLNKKLETSIIKSIFPFYYNELYNYYNILYKEHLNKDCYTYKDENFGIYYFKNTSNIELMDIDNNQDITFYIILDGLIKYKNQLFGNREVIFSNSSTFNNDFTIFTPSCSIIVFIIKKDFLKCIDLQPNNNNLGTFKLYTLKIFDIILNYESINTKNYIKLFQIALYLNERISHKKINILDTKYLIYKKNIIKTVKKYIFLSEKEITEKLLLTLDVSVSKLYKIFSCLFFTTPNKYIESIKILKTYYLLANTNEKIENICEQIGYSPKAFKEKFIARTGYSPSNFRSVTKGR